MLMRGLKLLLIAIAALGLLAIFAMVLALPNNPPITTYIAIVLGFIAVSALLVAWWWSLLWAKQGRDAATVLNYLEQAVRLNLPLPRMVRAIGGTTDRMLAKRMQAVAADLEQGAPLATALRRVPRISRQVLAVISTAENVGSLPQALGRLMERRRESIGRRLRWIPFYRLYPLVLGMVFIAVSMMFFVFVVPKFEMIFRDFKVQFPTIVLAFFAVARFCWPWIVLLLLAICALLSAWTVFGWWRGVGFGLIESAAQRAANYLPIIGTARRYRALADALDYCADAVEIGHPFGTALAESAQLAGNATIARKLRRWADAASRGASISDAARHAGMPRFVVTMLSTALYANGFVAAMRFLARYYRHRFLRSVALIEASSAPVIAISMGILVLWLALSVIAPLIALIQTLSSPASGPHL
jgi:type II secretory pathway component PulF